MYKVSSKSAILLIVLILLLNDAHMTRFMKTTTQQCNVGYERNGQCLNTSTVLSTLSFLTGDTSRLVNGLILPLITSITGASSLCFGDYSSTEITSNVGSLTTYQCNTLPLDNGTYGILSAKILNVPCGTPQTVTTCITFDRCGTFGFVINGGVMACAATYSTGIGALLSPVSDILDYLGFAFSLNKKLTKSVTIAYESNGSVASKTIVTKGHFYVSLGLSIPFLEKIKIGNVKLSDYIALDVSYSLLIDFGNVSTTVSNLISSLKDLNKNTVNDVLNEITKTGAEMTAIIEGDVTLKLDAMTNGFMSDLSIELFKTAILITSGGGTSGMNAGLYMSITTNILDSLMDSIQEIYNHYESILGKIGFSKPSLGNTASTLGLFIQTDYMGFQFQISSFTIKCLFSFYDNSGSCQFGASFFTAIIDGANWVVKKATKLFDKTGTEICKFAKGTGKFISGMTEAIKKIDDAAEQAAKAAEQAAKAAAEQAAKAAEQAAKAAEKAAKEAAEQAAKAAEKAAKAAANSAKKIFKKW